MPTQVFKVIGATLIALSTVQMATAAENHARWHRAPPVDQFRNSNAYAAPDGFTVRPSRWSAEDEAAMASGIAGH